MPKTCMSCKAVSESGKGYREISVFTPGEYCPACVPKVRATGAGLSVLFFPVLPLMAWLIMQFGKPEDRMVGWGIINVSLVILFQWLVIFPHELGHALTARALGKRVHKIVWGIGPLLFSFPMLGGTVEVHAYPFGGWTLSTDPIEKGYRLRKFLSVAGGPLVNLLLLGFAYPFVPQPNPFKGVLTTWQPWTAFAIANVIVLFWNLLPGQLRGSELASDGLNLLRIPFLSPSEVRNLRSIHYLIEGLGAMTEKQLEEALRWNREGLRLFPESVPIRNNLAVTQARLGLYELARDEFKAVAGLAGVDPEFLALAQSNIAFTDLMLDRPEFFEEAERLSTESMRHLAWMPFVRGTRGAVLISCGKIDEGLLLAKEAFERQDDPGQKAIDACFIALGLRAKGRADEGVKFLESAERLSPGGVMLPRVRKAYGRPEDSDSAQ